uniref:Uncharacterized protein n=1 Tax=Nothoprocta perdicaria TaxID=30464 RepID=A0A8C6YV46_NOTPE
PPSSSSFYSTYSFPSVRKAIPFYSTLSMLSWLSFIQTAPHLSNGLPKSQMGRLMRICSVKFLDLNHCSALHVAVVKGNVTNLLECNAEVNAKNQVGWTPLHLALLKGNMAIIKTLIMAGALLDVEDITGCMALQLAIRPQRENIFTLLQGTDSPVNR